MDYLRNVFGRKQIKFLIISGISLLVGLIIVLVGLKLSKGMVAESMASRWGDEKDFSQISVYLSELAEYDENSIMGLAYNTEKKLKDDSITAEANARLFIYAYSSIGKVNITSQTATLSAKAIGVGGDFFLFHPLDLITGSTFDSQNINNDLIVIDRETAYALFGSIDVVGMSVQINGRPYIVSGVVERDKGRLNKLAGNDESIVYLSFSSVSGEGMHINMYETLMPNPISNYAKEAVNGFVGVDEKYYEIVENTGRFHFTKLLKKATEYGTRSMNSKGIVYPYWENMARGMEDYLTPLAVLGVILFVIPALCVLYVLLRLWKLRTIHIENIKDYFERLAEKAREQKKKKKEEELKEDTEEDINEESAGEQSEDDSDKLPENSDEASEEFEEQDRMYENLLTDDDLKAITADSESNDIIIVPKLSLAEELPKKKKKRRK